MKIQTNINNKPLCTDLDGSLIETDSLIESIVIAIKKLPYIVFLFPLWLFKGKLYFKVKISEIAIPNVSLLPYNKDVLSFLNQEKAKGREIVLATASMQVVADAVSNHLPIFDNVMGSNTEFNLRSQNKKSKLVELYGEKGFDYIGDSSADLAVWASADKSYIVNPSASLLHKAKNISNVEKVFAEKTNKFKLIIKQVRVLQWVKNILIFFPLILAHRYFETNLIVNALLGFLSFSLSASFVYVLNDLLDLESDRKHPNKKYRPLASGKFPIFYGLILIPILLVSGLLIAIIFLPINFFIALLIYVILTTLYSFVLKKIVIFDILILAGLYTLRLLAGSIATGVDISFWLLTFSMFIFLSLAIMKRYTELLVMKAQNRPVTNGRGYVVNDIELILSAGISSGFIAVLIFALYVNSKEVIQLYHHHQFLWAVIPCILYWITRMWFLTNRGKMHDDPIVFTVKDKASYIIGIIAIILILGASL